MGIGHTHKNKKSFDLYLSLLEPNKKELTRKLSTNLLCVSGNSSTEIFPRRYS